MANIVSACPFCGCMTPEGRNVSPYPLMEMIAIVCPDCHMQGPRCGTYGEAVEAWNSLPKKKALQQLEKEADWLACELEKRERGCRRCPDYQTTCIPSLSACGYRGPDNWREGAREAIRNEENHNG